jgi:toxin YoeB
MKFAFTPAAWDDYVWFAEHDRKLLKQINSLLKEALRTPFTGTGKRELLNGELAGCWSRRIDHEHRLVYKVATDYLTVISCRYQYDD